MSKHPATQRLQLPPDFPFAAVGPYRPGDIAEVEASDAARLVAKGFIPADAPVSTPPRTEE